MSKTAVAGLTDASGELTRSGLYRLAAETDADHRVVESEWERWREGAEAEGPVRKRVRRVAKALGIRPPQLPEAGRGSGPEAA